MYTRVATKHSYASVVILTSALICSDNCCFDFVTSRDPRGWSYAPRRSFGRLLLLFVADPLAGSKSTVIRLQ